LIDNRIGFAIAECRDYSETLELMPTTPSLRGLTMKIVSRVSALETV
jgi:hypothetical protein